MTTSHMTTRHQAIANLPTRSSITDWVRSLGTPLALTLAILLGVQLLAAILLGWGGSGALAPVAADAVLLPFDPKAVTALRIEGGGQTLTLARGDQGWLVADLGDFPAEGAKIDQLLDTAGRAQATAAGGDQPGGPQAAQGRRRRL